MAWAEVNVVVAQSPEVDPDDVEGSGGEAAPSKRVSS